MEYIMLLAIIGLIGVNVWKMKNKDDSGLEKKIEEAYREKVSGLEVELGKAKSDRDKLSGQGKELYAQKVSLETDNKVFQSKTAELSREVTTYKNREEQTKREFEKRVADLEESRKAFEDEKVRIRREDEERLALEEADRDRVWNEHENVCLAAMKEVCQKPELGFSFYENTSLPDSFDGTLKPDFLVEFLGQYIIFDAKMSRSSSLQNYLNEQVKKTVKKIKSSKNKDEIYNTVFFIIPTIEFADLKKTHFYEEGYNFFVIPVEAFEAILSSFKRITNYELAESFDPKERENIVNLIASYDHHISRQNAVNLLTSIEGLKVMHRKGSLSDDIKESVETTKKKMRLENFKPTDLKRFIDNPEEQIAAVNKLVSPRKPAVSEKELLDVQQTMLEE